MDVLQGRIAAINRAFQNSIEEYDYPAGYQTFFPSKVNQQRQVVEAITGFGKRHNIGLEVGSKPELVAAISFATGKDLPIICNGYKDNDFIETILYANKIGYNITIVVEKLFELFFQVFFISATISNDVPCHVVMQQAIEHMLYSDIFMPM